MVASQSREITRNSDKSLKLENRSIFLTDPCLRLPFGGNPLEFGEEIWRQKTRVVWLPDGEEIMPLAFFVLTPYRRVTDGRTDRHVAITITGSG